MSKNQLFKNPFSFKGRINRKEYNLSLLIFLVILVITVFLVHMDYIKNGNILVIINLYFIFAQQAKRCHDIGDSAFYVLIPFYSLLLIFANSQNGDNKYGPNPKGIYNNIPVEDPKSNDDIN